MQGKEVVELKTQNVFDAETDTWVTITQEQKKYANYVFEQFQISHLYSAVALKKIWDEKLYLNLGYESKEEFCSLALSFGLRTAQKLIKIADKFSGYLPQPSENKQLAEVNSSDTLENTNTSSLLGLSINQLYELTKLDDEDLKGFLESGTIGEGEDKITLEEYKEMSVREATKDLRKHTAAYKEKIAKQSNEISSLKQELKYLESENETFRKQAETAEELEKKFGAPAANIEHKKKYLREAEDILESLRITLVKANVLQTDVASVANQYSAILKTIDQLHADLIENFGITEV